ncbi:MAG TPA: glycosyltransferase N-terminal domain-containing protein [Bacteroidia bacterium]
MLIYTLVIRFYHFIVRILSPFNKKAKLFTKGRSGLFQKIKQELTSNTSPVIWIHAASLGEFEQGRPVIEKLKTTFPDHKIVLTFFSPSGYELRKDYDKADYVFYLPTDTKSNAKQFIELVKPKLVIFIKYEFWLNYLNQLHVQSIPTLLISGIFRPDQHFFKWYGGIFKRTLFHYKHLFLQNEESLQLLQQQGIKNCSVAGDTRFDRVLEIAAAPKKFEEIEAFTKNNFTILAGSTWAEDEKYLLQSFSLLRKKHPETKLLIAPHNIESVNIHQLLSLLKSNAPELTFQLYTQWDKRTSADILVVDTIGMLSSLYQYAQVAYIGGGFGSGIHNILEALVYGIPVVFGPNYGKFNEAHESIKKGISFPFGNQDDLNIILNGFLSNKTHLEDIRKHSTEYVKANAGSSDKIVAFIPRVL